MNNVNAFCDRIQEKLEMLQGRMDSLKRNIGTNWHSLQTKLVEVREKDTATRQGVAAARDNLEELTQESHAEVKSTVDQWVHNHETDKLAGRARQAEDCAWMAISLAQASIDDAERLILEAIAAGRDADAVTTQMG